jgi:hypothetical protein
MAGGIASPGNASPVKKKTPPNRVTLSEKGD